MIFAGNILSNENLAWGDKLGWINFSPDNGNVTVTDSAITGYAWIANYGWLNLNPDNGKVINDGNGNLSGYAWGENVGWINFTGVIIDPNTGRFSGQTASTSLAGVINFSCDNCLVTTSWRKVNSSISHSSSGGQIILSSTPIENNKEQTASLSDAIVSLPKIIYKNLVPDFLKKNNKKYDLIDINSTDRSSLSLVMSGKWNIFPHQYTDLFVLAPLPKEIRNLAIKFPKLNKILNEVGVAKITDLEKLKSSKISLPHLSDVENIPSEIVFSGADTLNIASSIQISDRGEVEQKIETIVNKKIKLSVKPNGAVDSVTGYLAFLARPNNSSAEISMDSIFASAILASVPFASDNITLDKIEKKMIVSSFAYTDDDKDGVYTTEIMAPQTEGDYEVITLIKYSNPEQGTKEIRLVTVIDPEGYVFEKLGPLEARVPSVKVSIYKNNTLWNAKEYNQENPQITDKTGKYSFLVPEGEYYVTAEAKGYDLYRGDSFVVSEGKGIHFNIELKKTSSLFKIILDWKLIVIIILSIALIIGFISERRFLKKIVENNNLRN